jgi:hypothetical protein
VESLTPHLAFIYIYIYIYIYIIEDPTTNKHKLSGFLSLKGE